MKLFRFSTRAKSIYPFDKDSGFVRISRSEMITKIENEIGETKQNKDPTKNIPEKFQKFLSSIKKEVNMDD